MRVMVIIKANKDSEAGVMPSRELLTEMGRSMKLITQDREQFSLTVREIGDQLRPAMRSMMSTPISAR